MTGGYCPNGGERTPLIRENHMHGWLKKNVRASGIIEDTAIIFLTNRECPFHCLMCDLWKNTTDVSLPAGAIPEQIEWALKQLPEARNPETL